MGRKSIRKNKNVYQLSREAAGLTREAASERMETVSPERIEKIESEKALPHPDEIVLMERAYGNPELCNHYCSRECPIGIDSVPEASLKPMAQITVEILTALNAMEKEKDRLLEISVDGRVNDFERRDFDVINEKLRRISLAVEELRIWINHARSTGKIDDPA